MQVVREGVGVLSVGEGLVFFLSLSWFRRSCGFELTSSSKTQRVQFLTVEMPQVQVCTVPVILQRQAPAGNGAENSGDATGAVLDGGVDARAILRGLLQGYRGGSRDGGFFQRRQAEDKNKKTHSRLLDGIEDEGKSSVTPKSLESTLCYFNDQLR